MEQYREFIHAVHDWHLLISTNRLKFPGLKPLRALRIVRVRYAVNALLSAETIYGEGVSTCSTDQRDQAATCDIDRVVAISLEYWSCAVSFAHHLRCKCLTCERFHLHFCQVVGVNFFYNINVGQDAYGRMTDLASYQTVDSAIFLLFRKNTGAAWIGIMYYCMQVRSMFGSDLMPSISI